MKPQSIQYNFGKVNDFDEVVIYQDGDDKFCIGYSSKTKMNISYVELKNIIVGVWTYTKEKESFDSEYFSSYDECVEIIKKRTTKLLEAEFEKGKVEHVRISLAIKSI